MIHPRMRRIFRIASRVRLAKVKVYHFTEETFDEFKSGSFFAESPASEARLRAGLGHGDREGVFMELTLDPTKTLDLVKQWKVARKLLKGNRLYRGYERVDLEKLEDLGFSEPRRFWDNVFDRTDASMQVVKNAQKARYDALVYDTPKDSAGRVWVVINPRIVSAERRELSRRPSRYDAELSD